MCLYFGPNKEHSSSSSCKHGILDKRSTGGWRGNKHQLTKYHKHQMQIDTIILTDSEQQLQRMIDKLDATCEQYGMAMNAKKTKTMIVEKTPEKKCEVNVKGQWLTLVSQAIQIPGPATVEHTGQCKTEVANRINQAKIAFWKKATILRSNISMKTRIRNLMCYVFSVVSYGCETWTYSKAIDHKINALLKYGELQKNVDN